MAVTRLTVLYSTSKRTLFQTVALPVFRRECYCARRERSVSDVPAHSFDVVT